jgi:hypothetical protein
MDYELTNEDWQNEIDLLIEEKKEWLDKIMRIKVGLDERDQIKKLCEEVIKWHELSKETYTLLEALYENFIPIFSNVDKDSLDFHTNIFFNHLEKRFQRVKSNYDNNIKHVI